jgi:hypothetical protein
MRKHAREAFAADYSAEAKVANVVAIYESERDHARVRTV